MTEFAYNVLILAKKEPKADTNGRRINAESIAPCGLQRMTEQEQRTLQLFETRTRQLILQYRDASELNRQLQDELRARDRQIEELKAQLEALTKEYANLKTAKMIQISSGENARRRNALQSSFKK